MGRSSPSFSLSPDYSRRWPKPLTPTRGCGCYRRPLRAIFRRYDEHDGKCQSNVFHRQSSAGLLGRSMSTILNNFVPMIYNNFARHCSWKDIWHVFRIVAARKYSQEYRHSRRSPAGRAGDATRVVRYKQHERMADAGDLPPERHRKRRRQSRCGPFGFRTRRRLRAHSRKRPGSAIFLAPRYVTCRTTT